LAIVKNQDGSVEKLFVKGDKYRMEGEDPAGNKLVVLSDRGSKQFYILNLSVKQYMPVPVDNPMVAASFPFEIAYAYREMAKDKATPYRIASEGNETVSGYECENMLAFFDGGGLGNHDLLRQCVSQELGFPVRVIVPPDQAEQVQEFNLVLTDIKEGPIAEALFSVPQGYELAKGGESQPPPTPATPEEDRRGDGCKELDRFKKQDCYIDLAIEQMDPSVCERIQDRDPRVEKECKAVLAAIEGKDPGLCSQFPRESSAGLRCYSKLAAALGDTDICEELKEGCFDKGRCIKAVAIKENDESLCKDVYGSSGYCGVQEECYAQIALGDDDISLCDEFFRLSGESYGCHIYFALSRRDPELCESIRDTKANESCAQRTKVAALKPELTFEFLKNAGWKALAREADDPTYCENYSWQSDRQECLAQFEGQTEE